MNTEYLFGIYQAKRRIDDATARKQRESALTAEPGGTARSDSRENVREEAAMRVFEAVRASVEGIWYFR